MNIIIADDHPMIAEGVKSNFEDQDWIKIVCMAKNGKEVLDYVAQNHVDLVLMDIEMPEMNGIECSKRLREDFPQISVIILSMFEEETLIKNFMDIGIKGYLLKTTPKENLIKAVRAVSAGETYFSDELISAVTDDTISNVSVVPAFKASKEADKLSKREIEIIALMSRGYTNLQIAESLFISTRTVETHRANIMRKTKTKNTPSLIRFAFKNGIL